MNWFIQTSLLCFAVSFSCMHAFGQDLDNVTVSGRILDQNGAIIPGAIVEAVLVRTKVRREGVADAEGQYRLMQLEAGVYILRVTFPNFAEAEQTITTTAGRNVQLDFALIPAGITADTVVVSEKESPTVDITRTVVGGTVNTHDVEALPNASRNPLDLIFTLPGVSEEPLSTRELAEDRNVTHVDTPEEAGTFAMAGGPAYSNNITIDGLDNNDDRAARERFQPSIEAIEEVQIIKNQFSAEYGRASGGRINIRTQGGSNIVHIRGFYFFRDDFFNANTFNNNRLGVSRLPFTEHNPGLTVNGPVTLPKRSASTGRTFFFTAYEYSTILDTALIHTFVPVAKNPFFALPAPTDSSSKRTELISSGASSMETEIAPYVRGLSTPQRNHIFTTRVDHQFNDLHNGNFLFQFGDLIDLRQFPGGDRLSESLVGRTRQTSALSYSDNFVFSANAINQARAQFSLLKPGTKPTGPLTPVVLIDYNYPEQSAGDLTAQSGTLVAGSSTGGATARRESRIQFQDIFSLLRGEHSLKFGVDVQRIQSTFINLSDASGTFNFASAGDFLASIPSRFRQNFLTSSTQRNAYVGVFVQDEWRFKPNLTFSYGLRWESESIVRDTNNFGPRVAAAFDPLNSGKTVFRVGAGIFYNRALLRTIDDFTLGAQQLSFDTNDLIDPVTGRLGSADFRRDFIKRNIRFPQPLTADSPMVREFGVLNTGFSRRLDPTLRIPESYQANIGIERELGKMFVVEANYTWNRGMHLWREFNVNAPQLPSGFKNFSEYLASHDLANFRASPFGTRPIYSASTAGDLVRFTLAPLNLTNSNAIGRVSEFGVPISVFNLNSFTSATVVDVALAAIHKLRPDPSHEEVEQLISVGNSDYHGLTLELRQHFTAGRNGVSFSFRAGYTMSRLIDDGVVNTSDALIAGDFRGERASSLLDRRHRFVFSGTFKLPGFLGKLSLAPVVRFASGAPFNISIGGADRNLDDVGNDRPNFNGDTKLLRWRERGQSLDPSILSAFTLPPIGQSGNLPRNAGRGPGQFFFDLNLTREFKINNGMRLRPVVEIDNVLNRTVFSFGSEFINFDAFAPNATPEQKQRFLDTFLVATRTLRPRQLRFGLRFDF